MFINPKDAPFAVAMAVFLLGLVRLLEEYPKPSAATLAIVGIGFGLSIGSRIMAGFGVIAAVLSIGLLVLIDAQYHGLRAALAPLGRLLLRLIPAAILAYAVMGLVWPWGVVNPLNPILAIETFSHFFEKPWHELYGGERITPPDMPRSYVPGADGIEAAGDLLAARRCRGVTGALVAVFRPALLPRTRAVLLSIALAALLPIAITVITRPAMYNGVRHFVFVLPPLAVAGGLAGAWIAGQRSEVRPYSLAHSCGDLCRRASRCR